MNDYNPPEENDSVESNDSDILVAGDGSEILTDGGVTPRDETVPDEFTQEDELTEREIAILSTTEGIWKRRRTVENVSSIAAGLRQIVEPDDTTIRDPPTETEVLVAAAKLRDLAEFLEDRVAPLALEDNTKE